MTKKNKVKSQHNVSWTPQTNVNNVNKTRDLLEVKTFYAEITTDIISQ